MRRFALLVVAAVAIGWGSIGLIVREVDLPAVAIVGARVWVATAVLGVWLGRRAMLTPDAPRVRDVPLFSHRPAVVVLEGVLLAGHWVALVAALQRAPIGTVLLVTYLAPPVVAVLAPRVLGERVSSRTAAALALAVGGVGLIASPTLGTPDAVGLGLAGLAGALLVALTLLSKPLSETYGGGRLAFQQMGAAGIALAPFALTVDWGTPRPAWAWLVVLGAVHTGLAVGLYLSALAVIPANRIGVLLYLEPASAIMLGWLVLAEVPSLPTLIGGAAVVAAGALILSGGTDAGDAVVTGSEVAGVPG